ncbi:hypothetical protein [Lysobacter sp. Root690]|uniref:hypothetical protein n=1 Tax=Lysobacter sp. Root690 TaxID=1736588 RepID=UPI0012F7A06F|nr:hypothetical protein [Lysobacter sp. Root690]
MRFVVGFAEVVLVALALAVAVAFAAAFSIAIAIAIAVAVAFVFAVVFARHSREGGNPVPFVRERLKSLDSRLRGNDVLVR